MNNSIKVRESGVELLRFLLMLMILNLHSFKAPENLFLSNLSSFVIFDYFRESICICCVNCFVIISGYFSIKGSIRGLIKLSYQTYFFVFFIYSLLLVSGLVKFQLSTFLYNINCLSGAYWFITSYVILYLFAPILNNWIESSTLRQLKVFLIVYFVFEIYLSFIYTTYIDVLHINALQYFNNPMQFLGLYILGSTVRKTKLVERSFASLISLFVICTLLVSLQAICQKIFLQDVSLNYNLVGGVYTHPLVIIQSLSLFLIFKKFNFRNKVVNYLGTGSLSIYLLHMHPDLKNLFYSYTRNLYNLEVEVHIIKLIGIFVVIIILSYGIDYLRKISFNYLIKFAHYGK